MKDEPRGINFVAYEYGVIWGSIAASITYLSWPASAPVAIVGAFFLYFAGIVQLSHRNISGKQKVLEGYSASVVVPIYATGICIGFLGFLFCWIVADHARRYVLTTLLFPAVIFFVGRIMEKRDKG